MYCPACATEQKGPSRGKIAFCDKCGHRWAPNSDEEQVHIEKATYTLDYSGYKPDQRFVETVRGVICEQIVPRISPPARVLDVGCGAGDFMMVMKDIGYDIEGIDISEASAKISVSKGLKARAGNFLTEEFSEKYDLITMWDVVEHLQSPADFFRRASGLLSDGGYFLAKVPSFGDMSVRISNVFPRTAGALLGAPGHVQYFDVESLDALLGRMDFNYEWLPAVTGGMRAVKPRKSIAGNIRRSVRQFVKNVSGDGNLYFMAQNH